jgi:hypothetical protein
VRPRFPPFTARDDPWPTASLNKFSDHLRFSPTIAPIAADYNIAVETLTAHLKTHHRFAHLDDRPRTVSLTADPDQAGSWANRAPEATWDARRSAYDLLHPELGDEWNQSGQGRFWVLSQQITDPPVIVGVAAPSRRFDRGHSQLEPARWSYS